MFFKCLAYDIKRGVLKLLPLYLYITIYVFAVSDLYCNTWRMQENVGNDMISMGDLSFSILSGIFPSGICQPDKPAVVRLALLILPFLLIVLYYPIKDLDGFGVQLLFRCKQRKTWLSAKIAYIFISCIILFLAFYLSQLVYALANRHSLSMLVNERTLISFSIESLQPVKIAFNVIYVMFLTVLVYALFELLLSLIIGPLFSYCIVIISLIATVFITSSFLPGNYIMLLRYSDFLGPELNSLINSPINTTTGALVLTLYLVIILSLLYVVFCKKYDILSRALYS